MTDQIEVTAPKTQWQEGSSFTATAYFRDRATKTADTPSTVRYMIHDLTTNKQVKDWTTVSPASSVSISVTATDNAIISDSHKYEKKQIIVESDAGTSTAHRGSFVYRILNLRGIK